mmetsp:Transcript_630/g.2491  ORF Transcript_630/g.2491 Transcript_630/m.2491 type:complete len:491 (+) Transcript_630:634-2106(+)
MLLREYCLVPVILSSQPRPVPLAIPCWCAQTAGASAHCGRVLECQRSCYSPPRCDAAFLTVLRRELLLWTDGSDASQRRPGSQDRRVGRRFGRRLDEHDNRRTPEAHQRWCASSRWSHEVAETRSYYESRHYRYLKGRRRARDRRHVATPRPRPLPRTERATALWDDDTEEDDSARQSRHPTMLLTMLRVVNMWRRYGEASLASGFAVFATQEGARVLKEAEPGARVGGGGGGRLRRRRGSYFPLGAQALRHPGPLPRRDAALGVRHDGEVPAVGGAEARDAVGRAVGAERVRRRDVAGVIGVAQGREAVLEHVSLDRRVGKVRAALAVGDPDAQNGVGHAAEQHRGRVAQDAYGRPAALELARGVVDEPRLRGVGQLLVAPGHPPEQREELAPVAHAEREGPCVGGGVAPSKGVELRADGLVEADRRGPAFGGVADVGVREAADEGEALERVERDGTGREVRRRDVPRLEPRGVEGGGHLAVAVRPFGP